MKAIFLDIDGVLNNEDTTQYTWSGYIFVEDKFIQRLKRIIEETNAVVVLSSDWRYDRDDDMYNQDYIELKTKLEKWDIHFYGFTPLVNNNRGLEIQKYLSQHPEIDNFVILDDRTDMEPNMDHLIKTLIKNGLTEENTEDAIKMLNK